MKFAVLLFPGSNCDDDMVHALGRVMGRKTTKVWHKDTDLPGIGPEDCVVVPGGFSYGDYVRAGAVARFSPIMQAVSAHAERGGRVLGICNGFQILCEAGLLPGALLRNANQRFICQNQYLRCESTDSALTSALDLHQVVSIPIAHAEGRYHIDDDGLNDLWNNDQVLFRYCNADGVVSDIDNPNGSRDHIAGIRNKHGNVFGMMPHPERAAEDLLGNTDGKLLLKGLIESVESAVA
ncbi:MAG: phosphoribosylformylglycinamidine synthase subunit PurQ [Bacteroidota bacterium]